MNSVSGRSNNLLIIISDEHRKDAMGCAGHPIVQTPNLDRLAARGTRFTNAYTPSPMCVPARASIACGDYVHQTGYWDSATPYDGAKRSWMRRLRDSGVEVTSIGKLHFRSAQDDNGFSEEILPMHVVDGIGWPIGLLRQNPPPYPQAAELAADVGIGTSTYTDYDLDITLATQAWLHERSAQTTPWAAFVSLVSPHYPLTCPESFYSLYNVKDIPAPIGSQRQSAPMHSELQNVARFFNYNEHFDEAKTREAIVAYYGLTSFMDSCVGRILESLDASGQADDTVVLYVSDHGDMLGDQGYWTKQVMYEQSAGVPMIVAGPGVPAGTQSGTATSLIDLAATAVEVCAVEGDPLSRTLPGVSLRQIATAPDDPDRTVLSEYHDGGSTTGTFMVRWQNFKYVHYVGHSPQLFDLHADPHELNDLAASSIEFDSRELVAEGERRLRAICNPDAVNARCFADQKKRIEALGGEAACMNASVFNHTPTPNECR